MDGLAKFYLQQNDTSGYRNRFVLVIQFLSVGRTNEVSYSRYDNCIWDYDNNILEMQWVEEKNNKQCSMYIGPALFNYYIDIFLLLVYLLFLMYLMSILL